MKHKDDSVKQPSLRKNFVMNALLAVSGALFPMIAFRYASHILGPAGTGQVSFATSVVAYFSMLAQLGVPTYGIRACAAVREDRQALTRTVHELLGINLGMDLLSYALLAVSLTLVPPLAEKKALIMLLSLSVLLNSVGMEWLYKALEQYTYISVRSILFKLTALVGLFLLVKREDQVLLYGGITIFAASASNLLNLAHAWKYVDFRRPGNCDWRRHLRPVMIFFAISCAATVYTNLDALMLGFMKADADVGYYNAAVRVKVFLVSLVTSLGAVLLPRSSYYVEHGMIKDFRIITEKALRFLLMAATGVSLYFMLFARECILFLSGKAFLPAVEPMQIILPTVLLIGLSNLTGIQMLVPLEKEKVVLKSEILGGIVDLVLNLLLIPSYGPSGAAIGTLAAEAVVLAVQYMALRADLKDALRKYAWGRLIAALFLATAASFWVKALKWEPLPALLLSALCFFGVYAGFLLWRKEETLTEGLRSILRFK